VSSAKLPELAEAKDPRELIEHRIEKVLDLLGALDRLFGQFLVHRTSGAWEGHMSELKKWMLAPPRPGGIEVKMVRAQLEQFDSVAG
jgi:hypothetical protein